MIEIVWEFVVKEEARGQFELAYGPGGLWSKLFSRCPGFRGTTVLRDTKKSQQYLTIDLWETEIQREQAITEHKTEYANVEAAFSEWTESMTEVGIFSVLAKATVRPRGKARPRTAGTIRRRNHRTTR